MDEFEGIVINSIDYKEKSKIVYLYTPYGHESIRATKSKDYKSGFIGFTTTLNVVNYMKTKGEFPSLIEYNVKESFYDLTSSILVMKCVSMILQIIKSIPNDTNHYKTYYFILDILKELNNNNPKKVLCIFLIKMLYVFGVQPSLKKCSCCGRENNLFLCVNNGLSYCSNCYNNKSDLIDIWKEYYYDKKNIEEYSNTSFDELLDEIKKYYNIFVNITLK